MDAALVFAVEHGAGRPVVVLHGAGVDHRETEACFEPHFAATPGYRRVYPDLPGMGRTPAHADLRSAEDVLVVLTEFIRRLGDGQPCLLLGHSMGAYYAQAIAARTPRLLSGLALVCPFLGDVRDVPEHRAVVSPDDLGTDAFRDYFVIQTPEMLQRYETLVAPAAALADEEAMERIGKHWELGQADGVPYEGPTLIVAGRRDATVGSRAAMDAASHYPRVTLAVVDDAGHALPHEQPELLGALISEWLTRVERGT